MQDEESRMAGSMQMEESEAKHRAQPGALTHIESSDNSGGIPRHELQVGGRLAVQELALRREPAACIHNTTFWSSVPQMQIENIFTHSPQKLQRRRR